jgi:hypothetical protein
MKKTKKVLVKIEYNAVNNYQKEPEYFESCKDNLAARLYIKTIKRWGIGIKSCKIVSKKG